MRKLIAVLTAAIALCALGAPPKSDEAHPRKKRETMGKVTGIGGVFIKAKDPDRQPATARITTASRSYQVHIAGLRLAVTGLAWQQQDSAVAACATVALWSALHSSAFEGHHAIPTTASVTRAANRTASLGSRTFPSDGLSIFQLLEAIKEHGLSPIVMAGDRKWTGGQGFGRERFAASCSALLRSGYPVLVLGQLETGGMRVTPLVGPLRGFVKLRSCGSDVYATDGRVSMSS